MTNAVNIQVSSVMKKATLVVNVTGVKTWKARLWVGIRIIRLAAYVIGCGFRVEHTVDQG